MRKKRVRAARHETGRSANTQFQHQLPVVKRKGMLGDGARVMLCIGPQERLLTPLGSPGRKRKFDLVSLTTTSSPRNSCKIPLPILSTLLLRSPASSRWTAVPTPLRLPAWHPPNHHGFLPHFDTGRSSRHRRSRMDVHLYREMWRHARVSCHVRYSCMSRISGRVLNICHGRI